MIGLDVGSTSAKIVFYEKNKIKSYKITKSYQWRELLENVPQNEEIISTGYFRNSVPHKLAITEITCAIYGTKHFFPNAEVIVDIGGQDTKVIDIRNNSFFINDKCSAGTGAFLELVAKNFNLKLNELGEIAQKANKKAEINNTCAVFAISEMISQLVQEYSIEEVLAGIHHAFSEKIAALIDKEVAKFIKQAQVQAKKILTKEKKLLERIAKTLIEKEVIEREEFERLIRKKKTKKKRAKKVKTALTAKKKEKPIKVEVKRF